MSTERILVKSFYWKILQFIAAFCVSVLITRRFGVARSGEFFSLIYLQSMAAGFFTFGLDISLNYFLSRRELSVRRALRISLGVILGAGIVWVPLSLLFFSSKVYGELGKFSFLTYGALFLLASLGSVLATSILTAFHRNPLASMVSFGGSLLLLIVLGAGILFPSIGNGKSLFTWYFAVTAIQGICLLVICRRNQPLFDQSIQSGQKRVADILRFSFYAFLINFLFLLANRILVLLMPYHLAPDQTANFLLTFKILEYGQTLVGFIYYPFIAVVAGAVPGEKDRVVLALVRLSNSFVLIASLGCALFGKIVFPALLGKGFEQMYGIFLWLIPGFFALCASSFFTAWFFATGKLRYNLVSALVLLFAMGVLYIMVLPAHQPDYFAMAFSIASVASLAYDLWVFRKYVRFRPQELAFANKSDLGKLLNSFRFY